MNNPVPDYLVPSVLGETLLVVAAVLFGLHRALKLAEWPARDRSRAVLIGSLLLVAWLFAALLPSWFELYRGSSSGLPTILVWPPDTDHRWRCALPPMAYVSAHHRRNPSRLDRRCAGL